MELRPARVFQVTGLAKSQRDSIGQMIVKLGGTYIDSEDYKSSCTYLICGKPSRSEKYLAACSTGRWILQPKYIHDCSEKRQWLKAEAYEWTEKALKASSLPYKDHVLAVQAARRCRIKYAMSDFGAFAGWNVAVLVKNATKKQVYRRLLMLGGATVHTVSLPIVPDGTNKLIDGLTHIFVDNENIPPPGVVPDDVLCLKPDYIGEFLFKDPPPDPRQFAVVGSQDSKANCVFQQDQKASTNVNLSNHSVMAVDSKMGQPNIMSSNKSSVNQLTRTTPSPNQGKSRIKPYSPPVAHSKGTRRASSKLKQSSKTPNNNSKLFQTDTTPNGCKVKQCSITSFFSPKSKCLDTESVGDNSAVKNNKGDVTVECCQQKEEQPIYPSMRKSSRHQNMNDSSQMDKTDLSASKRKSRKTAMDLGKGMVSSQRVSDFAMSALSTPPKACSKTASKLLMSDCCRAEHTDQTEDISEDIRGARCSQHSKSPVLAVRVSRRKGQTVPSSMDPLIPLGNTCSTSYSNSKNRRNKLENDEDQDEEIRSSQSSIFSDRSLQPRVRLQQLNVDDSSLSLSLTPASSHGEVSQSASGTVQIDSVRKRLYGGEASEKENLMRKRKKLSGINNIWQPRNVDLLTSLKNKKGILLTEERSYPMTSTVTSLFETGLEEGEIAMAVNSLVSLVSSHRYPQSKTLHQLMNYILMVATDETTMYKSYNALRRICTFHPPTTPALRTVYLHALHKDGVCDKENTGAEWGYIRGILDKLIQNGDEEEEVSSIHPLHQKRCTLLLTFLVTILEQDFQHMMLRTKNGMTCKQRPICMLGQILWPGGQPGILNTHCKELFTYLTTLAACQDITDRETAVHIVQSLVTMAAEYTELLERLRTKNPSSIGDRSIHFAREVAHKIITEDFEDISSFELVLNNLKPSWLCMKVCEFILNSYDESLLPLYSYQWETLDLKKIVSRYLYVLPALGDLSMISPHKKLKSLGNISLKALGEHNHTGQSTRPSRGVPNNLSPAQKRRISQVNKRNARGETPLHIACMKNNVTKVKELLTTPGVNVNIKDYAGWTALHEACNHGHVECVMEILKYKPPRTIHSYFDKGNCNKDPLHTADLRASNLDGITPLHDAVQNDHLDVAKLLLQYGGSSLLDLRTKDGSIPMDVAFTDDMKTLLRTTNIGPPPSITPTKRRLYSNGFSQSSQDLSQTDGVSATYLPDAEVYAEVLGTGTHRKHVSKEECQKLVLLVYNLLKSYICFNALKLRRVAAYFRDNSQLTLDNSQLVLDNSQSSQSMELEEELLENITNMNSVRVGYDETKLRDMDVIKDLRCHVRGFEAHLNTIGNGELPVTFQAKIIAMKYLGP